MKTSHEKSVIASYATFKELYDSEKYRSPYQILSEFIRYVIVSRSLRGFTSADMQGYLREEFGFQLPLAVIRTAMRAVQGVTVRDQIYQVGRVQERDEFRTYRQQSEEQGKKVTDALLRYAEEKQLEDLDEDRLVRELIAFEIDESGDPEYQKLIGTFVLSNENNPEVTAAISTVREGSILYTGLAFNISEYGSLEESLTLFLDTEIIFHIMGYNGLVYEKLARDFLDLVQSANRGKKMITLKIFSDVVDEIENFFFQAERVVSGSVPIIFKQAMKKIIEGCESASDVSDKKASLFYNLQKKYGIQKDEKKNYYKESDYEYNLEGLSLEQYPITKHENDEGYKYCSHIHKIRRGLQTTNVLLSAAVFVTGTQRVLDISRAITESQRDPKTGEQFCDYAISLSHITNLLWYKLNRGYGSKDFPQNLDAVIKARTILSGYITQGISNSYKDIQEKRASGELTDDEIISRLIALKQKPTLPEELDADNVDESMDFTEDHLSAVAEILSLDKVMLKERERTIEALSCQVNALKENLVRSDEENKKKQVQIDDLKQKVDTIMEEDTRKERRRRRWKIRFCLFVRIAWKLALVIGMPFGVQKICAWMEKDFETWIGITIGAVSLLVALWPIVQVDWKRYREQRRKIDGA